MKHSNNEANKCTSRNVTVMILKILVTVYITHLRKKIFDKCPEYAQSFDESINDLKRYTFQLLDLFN